MHTYIWGRGLDPLMGPLYILGLMKKKNVHGNICKKIPVFTFSNDNIVFA